MKNFHFIDRYFFKLLFCVMLIFFINNSYAGPPNSKLINKANDGNAKAQTKLALNYYDRKDYKQAFKWYQRAAKQGYPRAQRNLGLMYGLGRGIQKDDYKAFKWIQKAAKQGHAKAQNNLGAMYLKGKGTQRDYRQAFKWLQKAAKQGNARAQYIVGVMYKNGEGTRKDKIKARKWLRKAAEQGYTGP